MKDIFGKLSDSIKNTCKEAVDQTQKTVDQTRLRTEIASLKNDVKKLYQSLGQQQYIAYMSGQIEASSDILCKRITEILKDIDALEQKLGDVVHEQKDSFDSYKRDVKTTWNEELQKQAMEKHEIKRDVHGIKILKFCQYCDIGNAVDATYCINCGEKL